MFVLGMAVTYSLLGIAAALTGRLFGQLTSHPAGYFIVGNLCLLFGLSMLGLFEIRFPGQWGKARQAKKETRLLEVFFMGASSGFIAAPCTVPVLGALLTFVAQSRNVVFGFSLLCVFALGLGLILIVLGTFTGLLASLPKSGPWLERIKQVFGFFLLLVAEFFLLQAGKLM
jgi:thiol:disulfide interchange protein DsbD